jgi:uncharacterized protein (TIGR03435 family)
MSMIWSKKKAIIIAGAAMLFAVGIPTAVRHITKPAVDDSYFDVSSPNWSDKFRNDEVPPILLIRPTRFVLGGGGAAGHFGKSDRLILMGCNMWFDQMIHDAYDISAQRIILPANLPKGRFDYLVTVPDHPREKFQNEIKKQFGLVGKFETRETDILLLEVKNTNAPAIKVNDGTPIWKAVTRPHGWPDIYNEPITIFADNLESFLEKPVVDKTGLLGRYDIVLSWSQHLKTNQFRSLQEERDSLKKDILEEAGLELVPNREPIEVLVMEKAN